MESNINPNNPKLVKMLLTARVLRRWCRRGRRRNIGRKEEEENKKKDQEVLV